jgi:hypothetical protein
MVYTNEVVLHAFKVLVSCSIRKVKFVQVFLSAFTHFRLLSSSATICLLFPINILPVYVGLVMLDLPSASVSYSKGPHEVDAG